jgi:hypothetical protein
MRTINHVLRKNRKILEELIPSGGKVTVHRKRLEEKGYSFSYHTHHEVTKIGSNYIFCYEYGYLRLNDDYFMLVRRNAE